MQTHPLALPKTEAVSPKLNADQLDCVARIASCRRFQPGGVLVAAGERTSRFFVVKNGEIQVVDHSPEGDKIIIAYGPGEFNGTVDLLAGRPPVFDIVARTACEVYEVPLDKLRQIINDMPRLGETLLKTFLMRRQLLEEHGVAAVRVVGSQFSRDTHRIREFLARNKVPSVWIDLEHDPNVETLLKHFQITADQTPVVICGRHGVFRNPSNAKLAECLGLRRQIAQDQYDLTIVGAGPAGLAAAVYGGSEGLKTLLLDSVAPGGQAGHSSRIENYPGFPTGVSGGDLADRALVQAEKFGAELSAPMEVTGLTEENGFYTLHLNDGTEVNTKCVLITAGAAYRKLNLANLEQFEGSGVYYSATAVEAPLCRDSTVVVVGGGNSAGQAAVFLSEQARRVLLVIRGNDLGKSMSHYLVRRIEDTPRIEVRLRTEVTRLEGRETLAGVELTDRQTGQKDAFECPAVFVFIGAVPHTQWLPPKIELDPKGFVLTGQQVGEPGAWPLDRKPFLLETSLPGIFAAGDVRSGSVKRVASAVGEGAMAVQFVHQFLGASHAEPGSRASGEPSTAAETLKYEDHQRQDHPVAVR